MLKKILTLLAVFALFLYGCIDFQGEKEKKETYKIDIKDCVGCGGNEETEQTTQMINQTQIDQIEKKEAQDKQKQENQTLDNESKYKEEKNQTREENETIEQNEKIENTTEMPSEVVCVGPTFENINLTERSSLRYKNTVYNDECVSWNTVKKYYCKNESVMSANFNCEAGYWCKDGACIEYEGSCVDSDGNDTKKYGYVSYNPSVFSTVTEYDKCIDEVTIEEWICDGSNPLKQTLECGSGFKCSDGRCIKSKCKEKDGGINPLVFSYTSNEEESANDACIDDYTLREYYCYADEVRYVDIKCKDKCFDDSCMPKEES